ncbi:uncharacterized protein tasora isoform X2 [Mastacembelus armatus]|uniref:Transcription activation suppressor a n=1 Tax=Mastacembelus armatus TaxID=205130 RepID=A0A3Q3SB76_9TELE|nr:protein TASOR isoform X2 [Mastacembelus armatus]
MDASLARREAARPKRVSTATAELGANVSLQDGELIEVIELQPPRKTGPGPVRLGAAGGRTDRRSSVPPLVHQRHMPMEPLKFHIPRKTKEKRALFQYVSTESREYEDMMTILTSSYIDSSSIGCFTYCKTRLVHSELLEKEFVEKRREMKADGRTEKELEESYCFLLTDTVKLPLLCEKGLFVGQSLITVLGNPSKGVYLSRYSDLLHLNPFTPGTTGEIVIFKVMKGKVKSIYENMKSFLDPTPRFDSHISKNASKVTSLTSYRAFELTQQYFYEYSFDELRQRPRQVCPYAVVSFQFKGKDSPLPSKPLAPIRLNSQSAEGSKEHAQFTVWSGDLVKGDRILFQISLRSFSPPFLPCRLPEKLEIGCVMPFDQVTKLIPSGLFSYNLYNSSQEVVKNGHCCSLLEVIDRSRSTTSVTRLLQELEINKVVLVTPLTERGFLFLLSSVQMASSSERGERWKRSLQALFVFPDTRDVAKCTSRCASSSPDASESSMTGVEFMPRLRSFVPALHHALIKARANPPAELSAGVELQVREYLIGLNEGKVRQYPIGEYDSKLDERGKLFPAPKHHRVNMDSYLRSYLYNPALYLLSVARARQLMEAHCGNEPQEVKPRNSSGGHGGATGMEALSNARDRQTNTQKMQNLVDLILTCKRNAENEVKREEEEGGLRTPWRKRRQEQVTAEKALKYLKASQEPGRYSKIPVEVRQEPAPLGSLATVIGSLGLKDIDLRDDGSELAARLLSLLTGLSQAASATTNQNLCEWQEEGQRDSCPFDRLAARLGLPTNCDIDLRKQEELEEQTAGSISSLEGFSPSSHSGEMNHGAAGRGGGMGRRTGGFEEDDEEWEIPWVLIPITGLCSERYTQRDRNIPQDPRFQHLTTATGVTTTTKPPTTSPTPSPEPSSPPSPLQCPSPEPSPPPSPSQCPSPDPSPPPSPFQCPSPESSPPLSPGPCPIPASSEFSSSHTACPPSPSQCPAPQNRFPPSPYRCQSSKSSELSSHIREHGGANEGQFAPPAFSEFAGFKDRKETPQGKDKQSEEPSISTSIQASIPPAPERRTSPSPRPTELGKVEAQGKTWEVKEADLLEEGKETHPVDNVQKRGVEAAKGKKHFEQQKGEVKELVVGSPIPSSVSSSSARPLRDIDSIVDKHLGDFSSEIQLLLQEESIQYSLPQSPHSTSNIETTAPPHTVQNPTISQLSQYVSFYNPCPPVQDYVSSLHDSINSMLTEFDRWPNHSTDTSRTDSDTTLASKVSAFVSSIRAANGKDDEVSASSGDDTADVSASVTQTPASSTANDVWRPDGTTQEPPDATNSPSPPTSHVTLSVPTSVSVPVYMPTSSAALHAALIESPQSQWKPHQNHMLETHRAVAHNVAQDSSTIRTAHRTTGVDFGDLAGSDCKLTLPGFSGVPKMLAQPSCSSEPVSSSAPVFAPSPDTGPTPPATALSSVISQLQPEVFNSLVEIIKDIKRNSLQFYLHSTELGDQVYEEVKEHLLKQGNVEQSPVDFLNQKNCDSRLLVIIKNKDIAGHIHKIPGLMSLKQHSSVVFVGIDTLDDIRNNSYNELFVSGGCIVSDELVLNPDFITHDRLAMLLMFLEEQSSLDSVWKWKVHCKTHKKLKEQARFRRDAANLLEVLSTYQKRQIVEFLPYHQCDMMNHQSPDLDCLIELQARYTQYRHTVFLTEDCERFTAYSMAGIIVAGIEEILYNFNSLVGYHDIKEKQPIMDDLLSPKEHVHPLCSADHPQHLQQAGSSLRPLPHFSDQLVPDASCKDVAPQHSDRDYEVLRLAISHLRAERQAQQQQQLQLVDSQAECNISFLPNPVCTGSSQTSTPSVPGDPTQSVQLTPGGKAVAATLELIHSSLQPELGEEERREVRVEPPIEGRHVGGEPGGQRDGAPVNVVGLLGENQIPSSIDTLTPLSSENRTESSDQSNLTGEGKERADQQGDPAFHKASSSCPVEGDISRDVQSGQEQPAAGEQVPPGNSPPSSTTETNPGLLPGLQQQQLNEQLLPQSRFSQPSQQHRSARILHHPNLPRFHQPFASGPVLGPLTNLRRITSLLGPTPVWSGGLGPGGPALFWGFHQPGPGASLLGEYHNHAGQGNNRSRGGHRGGGFNGM